MTDTRNSESGDFDDPLKNYNHPDLRDALEQALADETVAAIHTRPFTSISPDTNVEQALHLLADRDVACALVEEGGKLVGIFSDRDVLNKVAIEYEATKHRPVRDVMTDNPVYVHENDSSAAALCVMAVMGYRHVPVVDRDHAIVGIVTPQRITSFLLPRVVD